MNEIQSHFLENGWVVIDLIDPKPVEEAREQLTQKLCSLLERSIVLEEYHAMVGDDVVHTLFQSQLTDFLRQKKFGRRIIERQLPLFKQLIGLDLLVQANPYLRMTRPFKKQDNIGYHRDTFYGGSPYEISVLIPFVDLEKESSLSVLSGSHVLPEALFPTMQVPSAEVAKGSQKHNLGFLYAPKLMDAAIEEDMEALPLKVGQALLFSLSTVHGSTENCGKVTRWSTDIRLVNALAPVDLSARLNYYEPLCSSAVTHCAKAYFNANASS